MPDCIKPPHFPPHCGCPAGHHPDDQSSWTHAPGNDIPCTEAVPAHAVTAVLDRAPITEKLAAAGERMDRAQRELADLKTQAALIAHRLDTLDAIWSSPDVIRRTTLHEVWDKLMDAGSISGASVVMEMIRKGS